ncbi:hypothetical protein RRG08_013214 [Elysia crispata]|uniref:Uncharacterized protein n=1 Tax=Elysia crispata TaxID=231223 RepID=A0AAE1DYI0_9GAST|nr:hypothetical protein RRG08_013214 [Elysia crispata]
MAEYQPQPSVSKTRPLSFSKTYYGLILVQHQTSTKRQRDILSFDHGPNQRSTKRQQDVLQLDYGPTSDLQQASARRTMA